MKKILLSVVALAATSVAAIANETTISFMGNGDLFGLTRQTAKSGLTYTPEVSGTVEGVSFNITSSTEEVNNGFALLNAGGTTEGLSMSNSTPVIKLTVPGGKISAIKIVMGGYSLNALDLDFDGTSVSAESEGTSSIYSWSWTAPADAEDEEVTVNIPKLGSYFTFLEGSSHRCIRTITVTYTEDLGDKQECGLEFSETTADAIMGREYTLPELSNPNNLTVTWTSSDEDVATVDADGQVTLVGAGTTDIKASTEGNDEFAAGIAKYVLSVIPSANNLVEMLSKAAAVNDRVYVACPLTVTFGNSAYAYVLDPEGNPGYINDTRNSDSTSLSSTTIYNAGDVIPAGWIAKNATIYESVIWEGLPEASTEKVEVTYPEVTSISPADADRVVILKDVTFTTTTAMGNTKAYGTTPDGASYEFQDTYGISPKPAGTYNVKGAVKYSKRGSTVYFYMAPIEYIENIESGVNEIEAAGSQTRYFNLQGVEIATPENGVFIKVADGKTSKVIVK